MNNKPSKEPIPKTKPDYTPPPTKKTKEPSNSELTYKEKYENCLKLMDYMIEEAKQRSTWGLVKADPTAAYELINDIKALINTYFGSVSPPAHDTIADAYLRSIYTLLKERKLPDDRPFRNEPGGSSLIYLLRRMKEKMENDHGSERKTD